MELANTSNRIVGHGGNVELQPHVKVKSTALIFKQQCDAELPKFEWISKYYIQTPSLNTRNT